MILYNVTVGIDPAIEQDWLEWMKTVHIPDVMGTGMFVSNKVYKVFAQQEGDNPSYSIQYFAENTPIRTIIFQHPRILRAPFCGQYSHLKTQIFQEKQ